jgi:hypothetical protein
MPLDASASPDDWRPGMLCRVRDKSTAMATPGTVVEVIKIVADDEDFFGYTLLRCRIVFGEPLRMGALFYASKGYLPMFPNQLEVIEK